MDAPQHINLAVPAQLMRASDKSPLGELDIKFAWSASDPYAITMTFEERKESIAWHASADLFLGALIDATQGWHGEGDISVQFHENVCYVALSSDHDRPPLVAKMSAVGLAPFVSRISRLRILHADYIAWLIEKELDALLEAA